MCVYRCKKKTRTHARSEKHRKDGKREKRENLKEKGLILSAIRQWQNELCSEWLN